MQSRAVLLGAWIGLPRSPTWLAALLGSLLVPAALLRLAPFPDDPASTSYWDSISRWGALLSAVGVLAGLIRLSAIGPFLQGLAPGSRRLGELMVLGLCALSVQVCLALAALLAVRWWGGPSAPPWTWSLSLLFGALHLSLLGALVARWLESSWARAGAFLLGAAVLPAILPDTGFLHRFLRPLVDVGASIGYPSSSPPTAVALLAALALFLAAAPTRPIPS